jgi:hypothetical protein
MPQIGLRPFEGSLFMLLIVFIVSTFLSSALLFLVEPMIAKMLLPMLGGTPSLWNTCLVFFQATLLVGYLYAHALSNWLSRRAQIMVHLGVVLLPFVFVGQLPLHLPAGWEPPTESSPVIWVFATLFVSVGLPFFILSSTAPILQRWFADSGRADAADPYFLYATSNAGSLTGLLAYPVLVEPLLRLNSQSVFWSAGYLIFVGSTAVCAVLIWRKQATEPHPAANQMQDHAPPISTGQRIRWVALAFVPSSLVLGITTMLTTDFPAIPLLWVLTLALYLLSFILVFAKRPPLPHEWMVRCQPLLILAPLFLIIAHPQYSFLVTSVVYLIVLFGIALVCHGELARGRPSVKRLTEFYLWISFGGVLGGIFNALVAPVIFRSVLELPLVLVMAAVLRQSGPPYNPPTFGSGVRRKDWLFPIALGISMLAIILLLARFGITPGRSILHDLFIQLFFAYSLLWCFSFAKRPWRFAGGLVAILVASSFYSGSTGRVINTERSFFGVSRVSVDARHIFHLLVHGGTIHGVESLDPAASREPLSYYTNSGPAGQIFRAAQNTMPQGNWAIVGLGAGAMACYLQPAQTLTYYEIDPVVVRIAENPSYFRFLSDCAPHARIVLGDARLKMRSASDAQYGLIVLDAFSGDSIPMHLMTREAVALYEKKLAPHGIIAFHISKLYLDLSHTLDALARDAHLVCLIEVDTAVSQAEFKSGKYPSTWLVMARSADDLSVLTSLPGSQERWAPIRTQSGQRVWTDDYSNLLSAIRLR